MVGTNPKFDALLTHMKWLHTKKNHDYSSDSNPFSNFEEAAQYAGVSVDQVFKVLLGIKKARLDELTKSGKAPNNESLIDTYIDYTMYSALRTAYTMTLEVFELEAGKYNYGESIPVKKVKFEFDEGEDK